MQLAEAEDIIAALFESAFTVIDLTRKTAKIRTQIAELKRLVKQ